MNGDRWSADFLEAKRSVGDPTADAVIETIFQAGDVAAVNRLMGDLVRNEALLPEQLPPVVRTYLQATEALPDWSDTARIQQAEEVFCEFGPPLVVVLLCASLPECYGCGKGAHVLDMTNRLSGQAHRRIFETAQFLMDVMAPDGMASGGFGIRTTQKVRLMHAAIRHLASKSQEWDAEWGLPINQEDLAGTLMTFAIVAIDGLPKIGVSLSSAQAESYLHAWNNVGHVLGIQPDMLPKDIEDARALMNAIRHHQHQRTDAGIALMNALTDFMDHLVAEEALDGLLNALVWHLSGEEVAELLAVKHPNWEQVLLGPLSAATSLSARLEHRSAVAAKVAELVNLKVIEALIFVERGGARPPFRIPETLCDQWNVSPNARARTIGAQAAVDLTDPAVTSIPAVTTVPVPVPATATPNTEHQIPSTEAATAPLTVPAPIALTEPIVLTAPTAVPASDTATDSGAVPATAPAPAKAPESTLQNLEHRLQNWLHGKKNDD